MSEGGPASKRIAVEVQGDGARRLWFVQGLADGVAVRELYEAVAGLLEESGLRVIVDFAGVAHLSSGMLGMLVTATKKVRQAGGELAAVIPDANVREQVTVMRLDQVFAVCVDMGSARERLG